MTSRTRTLSAIPREIQPVRLYPMFSARCKGVALSSMQGSCTLFNVFDMRELHSRTGGGSEYNSSPTEARCTPEQTLAVQLLASKSPVQGHFDATELHPLRYEGVALPNRGGLGVQLLASRSPVSRSSAQRGQGASPSRSRDRNAPRLSNAQYLTSSSRHSSLHTCSSAPLLPGYRLTSQSMATATTSGPRPQARRTALHGHRT